MIFLDTSSSTDPRKAAGAAVLLSEHARSTWVGQTTPYLKQIIIAVVTWRPTSEELIVRTYGTITPSNSSMD